MVLFVILSIVIPIFSFVAGISIKIVGSESNLFAFMFVVYASACLIVNITFTCTDYITLENNGVIADTTIIIKNGVVDTVVKYKINYD